MSGRRPVGRRLGEKWVGLRRRGAFREGFATGCTRGAVQEVDGSAVEHGAGLNRLN